MRPFLLAVFLLFNQLLSASPIQLPDTTANADIIPAVASAIRSGDAQALASYFAATVDLTVPESEGTYSKSQAELIVKGFFNTSHPSGFSIRHQGLSGEGCNFCIGRLDSDNGPYRVYFLVKTINGQSQITQLQFEEE